MCFLSLLLSSTCNPLGKTTIIKRKKFNCNVLSETFISWSSINLEHVAKMTTYHHHKMKEYDLTINGVSLFNVLKDANK